MVEGGLKSSFGVKSPSELCGRKVLYPHFQSTAKSMLMTW